MLLDVGSKIQTKEAAGPPGWRDAHDQGKVTVWSPSMFSERIPLDGYAIWRTSPWSDSFDVATGRPCAVVEPLDLRRPGASETRATSSISSSLSPSSPLGHGLPGLGRRPCRRPTAAAEYEDAQSQARHKQAVAAAGGSGAGERRCRQGGPAVQLPHPRCGSGGSSTRAAATVVPASQAVAAPMAARRGRRRKLIRRRHVRRGRQRRPQLRLLRHQGVERLRRLPDGRISSPVRAAAVEGPPALHDLERVV